MGVCCCHRGGVCCEAALGLIRTMEEAYRTGLLTGDWAAFNTAREHVEQHFGGTSSEEEHHLHRVDVGGSSPSSRTTRGSPTGVGRGFTRR